jgi:biopolymer transport protein ExbD
MQVNATGNGLQSEINVTPLVDVVLVLLIIFMVVVPLLLKGYDIDIPKQTAATAPAQAEEAQVILTVVPEGCRILTQKTGAGLPDDCRVTIADRTIPVTDLPAQVAELLGSRPPEKRVLFLNIDDRLNYEGVLRIVDLARSGVDDMQIEFITAD